MPQYLKIKITCQSNDNKYFQTTKTETINVAEWAKLETRILNFSHYIGSYFQGAMLLS